MVDSSQKFPPRPLAERPPGSWRSVNGLLTDIDDTLTRDGAIEPAALAALHALKDAGVPVVAITGRPHGWSAPFARAWPIDAIVAENGAVALIGERTLFAQSEAERAANRLRLDRTAARVLAEVPGAALATDSAGRLTDIAIDHSEHHRLDDAAIARVVEVMRAEGLTATVSSIHVNGWIGSHSKASGAAWMLRELYGRTLDAERDAWVYVGDSTNDEAMFQRLTQSVGVANLLRFADRLRHWPRWLAAGERGAGFAEVAHALLADRR